MTTANFVAWSVKNLRTGLSYTVDQDQSEINFRANHPMDAKCVFNNSDNSVTNAFLPEDEVQIIINSVVMFDGYVYNVEDQMQITRRKNLNLYIMDWGSYLASKTVFEKDYQITRFSKDMLLDGIAKISGLSNAGVDTVTLGTTNFAVKGRRFQGTYVKDVWYASAETGGFDYFIDETKKMMAWAFDTVGVDGIGINRNLQIGGNNYQIIDFPPTQPYQLMVRADKDSYSWSQDVQNVYHSVVVENGLIQNYPLDITSGSTDSVHPKGYAHEVSLWYFASGYVTAADGGVGKVPGQPPFQFVSGENLGSISGTNQTFPTIHIYVVSAATPPGFSVNFQPIQYNPSATYPNFLTVKNMAQPVTSWQKLGFFINLKTLSNYATFTNVTVKLLDNTTLGSYTINILPDYQIGAANTGNLGWVYLEYNLPSASSSGFWTKTGNPINIDVIQFSFTPNAGWVVGDYAGFANLNLWGILGATAGTVGTPPTQQIITNRNITDLTQLQNFATRSLARSSTTKEGPKVTIDGLDMNGVFRLTDFKKPAYKINIDLSATLGASRVANNLRMDTIRLYLDSGYTYATITFDNSFYRP